MKMSFVNEKEQGLTLVEVLLVVMAVIILVALYLPSLATRDHRSMRIQCVNNLKQIGIASRMWESDHKDKYPMHISETNGGIREFTFGPNAFRYFQVMSNEISTPYVLLCPSESDKARFRATSFSRLSNSNLSYFVGLDATETDPQSILLGDRNITNGTPLKNGVLELTAGHPVGWTAEMHNKVGNIVLADGSVQQESMLGLREAITNAPAFTNRLLMPVLGP